MRAMVLRLYIKYDHEARMLFSIIVLRVSDLHILRINYFEAKILAPLS